NNSIPDEVDDLVTEANSCVSFVFQIVTLTKIISVLKNIVSKSDCQFLNKDVLLDAVSVIGHQIVSVINASLESGIFPKNWKCSILKPMAKISGSIKCEDFRPINMLPTYEKNLEAVVRSQLEEHLERQNIIVDYQSGFRQMHSCESALNMVIMEWK